MPGTGLVDVEAIGVLHEELPPAHDAEPGALLIPELPLDVIEDLRQVLVGPDRGTDDLGDHLLVGGAVEHLPLMSVLDAQHLLAVIVVTAALPPQVGQLERGHEQLHRPGAIHLLADDLLDLLQNAKAQRQPGIDPCGLLADHAGPQHEPVRDDLRLRGVFLQDGQKKARQAHEADSMTGCGMTGT